MTLNWFIVIWSLKTFWSSLIQDVKSKLLILVQVALYMTIWAHMFNLDRIGLLKLFWVASMTTRLIFGRWAAFWLNYSLDMFCSKMIRFKACCQELLALLDLFLNIWWRRANWWAISLQEKDLFIKKLKMMIRNLLKENMFRLKIKVIKLMMMKSLRCTF